MKYLLTSLVLIALLALTGRPDVLPVVDRNTPVYEALRSLGTPERADIMVRPVDGASADVGRQIVLEGQLSRGGKQSAHFKCTACHNVVREDPVLTEMDPAARLDYAVNRDLPFLPGTTLWGAVNRETYYNGDYEKKYGDLVKMARHDLREAIQLCATECAQGEPLDELEMESVVAYLHEIGLLLKDLPQTAPSVRRINRAIEQDTAARKGIVEELRASYLLASPATFVLPPENRKTGYAEITDPDASNGEVLYQKACLHCHEKQRYSFFEMASTDEHYSFLSKHFPRYTRYSTYQVSRYGTSPIPGKRAYMPHYTVERMSNQQLEDLRAFVDGKAVK